MRILRSFCVALFGAAVIACGGSDDTVAGPGDAASEGSGGGDGGSGGDGGNAADTGGADRDAGTAADSNPPQADASEAGGGDSGACPDVHGAYSIVASGAGCGDLVASAPECIQQIACAITFVSNGTSGSGLNGNADLAADGSFSGAAIKEGTVQRTGCTGTWNASTSTLTVDCGGVGSSQSCIATLTRTSTTCN